MLGFFVVKLKNRIVRLFIMTKITRRSFLKGAGVAALAVAAAGVMTGCKQENVPGTDIPNVPTVTSKEVTLIFVDAATGNGLDPDTNKIYTVLKDATVIDPKTIPVSLYPADWDLAVADVVEIHDNGNMIFAIIPVSKSESSEITETKEVEVTLQIVNPIDSVNTLKVKVTLPTDATSVKTSSITLPEGYEWVEGMEGAERPIGVSFLIKRV